MKGLLKNIIVLSICLISCLTVSKQLYSQREADRWYFGLNHGLNFNSGAPVVLYDGQTYSQYSGVGTMSDSLGNLLFYSELTRI